MTYLDVSLDSILGGNDANWVWGTSAFACAASCPLEVASAFLAGVVDIGCGSWGTLGIGTFLACKAMKFSHNFSILIIFKAYLLYIAKMWFLYSIIPRLVFRDFKNTRSNFVFIYQNKNRSFKRKTFIKKLFSRETTQNRFSFELVFNFFFLYLHFF